MNRQDRDSQVVNNGGNGGPQRQRRYPLGVERYDDSIARAHVDRPGAPKPSRSPPRYDIAIGAYNIYPLSIRLLRRAAALGDVIVSRQSCAINVRCGTLHFAQYGNFLVFLWNEQHIAIPQKHVARPPGTTTDNLVQIDHQTTDGLG